MTSRETTESLTSAAETMRQLERGGDLLSPVTRINAHVTRHWGQWLAELEVDGQPYGQPQRAWENPSAACRYLAQMFRVLETELAIEVFDREFVPNCDTEGH